MTETVLCDVDEVVADLMTPWFARYRALTNDVLEPAHLHQWDISQHIANPEHVPVLFSVLRHPDLYDDVQPVPGALAGVQELKSRGFRVVFVTASNPVQMPNKYAWLVRHGFLEDTHDDGHRNYITAYDKVLVRAPLGIIDDRLDTVLRHPDGGIIYDRPHNRRPIPGLSTAAGPTTRAHAWTVIPDLVYTRHAALTRPPWPTRC